MKWVFKKGSIYHLDQFLPVSGFVQNPKYMKPVYDENVSEDFMGDIEESDLWEAQENFTVSVVISMQKNVR